MKTMVDALLRECLVMLLREQCTDTGQAPTWLLAFLEPRLGLALKAMAERPEAAFTVATLAGMVSMSRATFTQRFTERL